MKDKKSLGKSITVIGGGPSGMMAAISAARARYSRSKDP